MTVFIICDKSICNYKTRIQAGGEKKRRKRHRKSFVFLPLRENSLLFFPSRSRLHSLHHFLLSAAPASGALAALQDLFDLGKLPLLVAQRARGAGLEPSEVFFVDVVVFIFCF